MQIKDGGCEILADDGLSQVDILESDRFALSSRYFADFVEHDRFMGFLRADCEGPQFSFWSQCHSIIRANFLFQSMFLLLIQYTLPMVDFVSCSACLLAAW